MQPQPLTDTLTDTFIEAVRYIYYNRRKLERLEIDRHLLSLDLDPVEIERAWKAVLAGQGLKIIKDAKKDANRRKLNPFEQFISDAIGGCLLFCLRAFLIIGSLVGLFCVGGWLDSRAGLPIFLTVPLVIAGFVLFYGSLIFTTSAFAKRKPSAGWGVFIIIVLFVGFFGAFFSMMEPPNPPEAFTPYPNAISLPLPPPDKINYSTSIGIGCWDSNLDASAVYATQDTDQQILDFYAKQAQLTGKYGLMRESAHGYIGQYTVYEGDPSDNEGALCYLGNSVRHYVPANGIMYVYVNTHQQSLKNLFPDIPPNTKYLIFLFNGILYTI